MKKPSFVRSLLLLSVVLLLLIVQPVRAEAPEGLADEILESCLSGDAAYISSYNVNVDTLHEVFWDLYYAGKLPWNMDRTYSYTYDQDTNMVQSFRPSYLDEDEYSYELYEQKVAEIIHATVFQGMTNWQKALSVHDYLVANTQYDESLTYYRGYDLLVRGTAVCNGYAEAYMDIMNRLGIPCQMVISDTMGDTGHSWNLLQLEGNWYHVDATWDDPSPDTAGYVGHDYFLKTDEEMLSEGEEGHHSWETDLTCTDTAYSDGFWKDVDSQICYLSADVSFLRRREDWTYYILSRNENTGDETLLYTIPTEYINVGAGSYSYGIKGLAFWNGRLYFSSQTKVFSVATDGSDRRTEHTHEPSTGTYIYSFHITDGVLTLSLSDHDHNRTEQTVTLAGDFHRHDYASVLTLPTCEEEGYTAFTCSCGVSYKGATVDALGHNYNEGIVVQKPTLRHTGLREFTCRNCSDSYSETIPATFKNLSRGIPVIAVVILSLVRAVVKGKKS